MILPVIPQIPLLCQQELPFEAFDPHPALFRSPFEAHGPQPPWNVAVHEAVTEVSIQSRLDVLIPPDVQQGPRLHVRPQEASCCVRLHSCQFKLGVQRRWIMMDSLDPGCLSYSKNKKTKKTPKQPTTKNRQLPIEAAWDARWVDPPKLPRCRSLPYLNVKTFRAG